MRNRNFIIRNKYFNLSYLGNENSDSCGTELYDV